MEKSKGLKEKSFNFLVEKVKDPKSHQSVLAVLGSFPGELLIFASQLKLKNKRTV